MKPSRALLQARATIKTQADELAAHFKAGGALQRELDEARARIATLKAANDEDAHIIAELEKTNAAIGQKLVDQGAKLNAIAKDADRAREDARAAEKARQAAEADNNYLRDTMQQLTVQKAHLEGQLARVREFDPITDQQAHREGLNGIHLRRDAGGFAVMESSNGAQPWYRRG